MSKGYRLRVTVNTDQIKRLVSKSINIYQQEALCTQNNNEYKGYR